MFLFLPFSAFLLSTILFKRNISGLLLREALLFSFLVFGGLILISTEILSIFKLFCFGPVCIFWGSMSAILLFLNFARIGTGKGPDRTFRLDPLPLLDKFLIGTILILVALLGIIAVTTPPNTWDAMTYHLARVAHWIQNKTIAFYPTTIQRQLYINPFAEYWVAHFLILLRGDDRFANTVQYFSMLGTLIGVSLIAKELDINRSGQILSAFFVVTLPNAIVQATSTQTDFVVTLWIVIAVYFMLKNITTLHWINTLAISMAFVLAFYTKGSCLFILLPFWVWMVCVNFKEKQGWQNGLVMVGLVMTLGFLLWRNYHWLGSSLFPGENDHELPLSDFKGIFSNLLLHYSMHLRTGFAVTDDILGHFLEQVHHCLGMTVLTSPANKLGLPFNYLEFPFLEDEVPNFIFFITWLIAGIWFFVFRRSEWSTHKGKFFLLSFLCFFVFNAIVKWSPFDGRYHLPFFVIFAVFLADVFAVHRKTLVLIVILFSLSAASFILYNKSKPLAGGSSLLSTPRELKYFYNQPGDLVPIGSITQGIIQSGCHQIGLDLDEDFWEYPFWAKLRGRVSPLRIEHVLVNNSSSKIPYPLGDFLPCAIVSLQSSRTINFSGNTYMMVGTVGRLSLYYFMNSYQ